jgi:hypothetical protein
MDIYVTRNVRVIVERDCYTIEMRHVREKGKNAGEVIWEKRGYHGTLKQAMLSIIEKELGETPGRSNATSVIEAINASETRIMRALGLLGDELRTRNLIPLREVVVGDSE